MTDWIPEYLQDDRTHLVNELIPREISLPTTQKAQEMATITATLIGADPGDTVAIALRRLFSLTREDTALRRLVKEFKAQFVMGGETPYSVPAFLSKAEESVLVLVAEQHQVPTGLLVALALEMYQENRKRLRDEIPF